MILILPLTEKDGEIGVDIDAEYLEDDFTQQVVTIYDRNSTYMVTPNETTLSQLLKLCEEARQTMKEENDYVLN